jgi:hypothetical protein
MPVISVTSRRRVIEEGNSYWPLTYTHTHIKTKPTTYACVHEPQSEPEISLWESVEPEFRYMAISIWESVSGPVPDWETHRWLSSPPKWHLKRCIWPDPLLKTHQKVWYMGFFNMKSTGATNLQTTVHRDHTDEGDSPKSAVIYQWLFPQEQPRRNGHGNWGSSSGLDMAPSAKVEREDFLWYSFISQRTFWINTICQHRANTHRKKWLLFQLQGRCLTSPSPLRGVCLWSALCNSRGSMSCHSSLRYRYCLEWGALPPELVSSGCLLKSLNLNPDVQTRTGVRPTNLILLGIPEAVSQGKGWEFLPLGSLSNKRIT